jgi:hypothetical protein
MKYPFLENNELILIDYVPGSSGQLLIRLWSELDAKLNYHNDKIISDTSITSHPASREIDYNILIPKRITNWFLDRCEPKLITDYIQFFEFLGTYLVAASQKWVRGSDSQKFYDSDAYTMQGMRILYGIHSWKDNIPFSEMQRSGYNIKCFTIVANTPAGASYQLKRAQACYPYPEEAIKQYYESINSKLVQNPIDFCTMLVSKDSDVIIQWLRTHIGESFREEKIMWAKTILNEYFREIVDNV